MKCVLVLASVLVFVAAESYFPWDPRAKRHPSRRGDRNNVFFIAPADLSPVFFPITSSLTSAQAAVNEMKDLLFKAEQKIQRFCRLHTDRPLKEAYGATHYRLYANMTGCREAGLEVRAGQRLVALQARDSRCDSISLRLLPDAVDSNGAFWRFENGQINIMFPYRTDRRRCGRIISDKVHRVPKFEADVDIPDVDVMLGDEDLAEALRSYVANHVVRRYDADWED